LLRATGEEAKMAGVPQTSERKRIAGPRTKSLNGIFIPKGLGGAVGRCSKK